MTSTPTIGGAAVSEARVVATLAREATQTQPISPAAVYGVAIPDESSWQVFTGEAFDDNPWRPRGTTTTRDAASFSTAIDNLSHGHDPHLFADADNRRLVAVLNPGPDGWGDHRVLLQLATSREWREWTGIDRELLPQVDFAEFVEQHTADIVSPDAATMLELAQSFHATRSVRFGSSQRLKHGETVLQYVEELDAKGRGSIAIPDTVDLRVPVFDGGSLVDVDARLRWRIHGQALRLGVVLLRPDTIERTAFLDVVSQVGQLRGEGSPGVMFGWPAAPPSPL